VVVLIHSPLVGPITWAMVADSLRQKGAAAAVPALTSAKTGEGPFWKLHARLVARALRKFPAGRSVLLVGHSGAGPLLPAVRQAIANPAAGYLFVDAGWPVDGKSRLDLFDDPQAVEMFHAGARNGLLPTWSDADLKSVIPDDAIRGRFVDDLRPLPLAVYEEALPVFSGWPDAPCGYLRFGKNPAYDRAEDQAQRAGCRMVQLEGEHFHMLVDPQAVTVALIEVAVHLGLQLV